MCVEADVVVFCRNVRPDRAELLRTAVAAGVPVLYDLDDNFFELSPETASGRTFAQPEQLAMLTEYLSTASLVRVYSRTAAGTRRNAERPRGNGRRRGRSWPGAAAPITTRKRVPGRRAPGARARRT